MRRTWTRLRRAWRSHRPEIRRFSPAEAVAYLRATADRIETAIGRAGTITLDDTPEGGLAMDPELAAKIDHAIARWARMQDYARRHPRRISAEEAYRDCVDSLRAILRDHGREAAA